ncbi:MAG: MMPL family transporter, partial [Nitrospinaceae bacterium]
MKRLLRGCFQNITRKHPGGVLAIGLILSALSIWTTTGLRYDSRMDTLLPEDLPLVREFNQVVDKTGGSTPLVVVLEGLDQTRAPQVLKDLSERLAQLDGARFVDWRIPKKFLENRQLLLASRRDLIRLERIMEDAVDYARNQFAGLFGGPELYNPADLQSLADEYKIFEPINPFYKGKSQTRYYLFVQPQGAGTNTDFIRPFIEAVKTEIGRSSWEEKLPGLKIHLTGSMMPRIEESETILRDLTKAAGLAVILATSIILIYTRSGFSIPLILIPLFVSLTYTLALTRLFIGHVNIISGFLVAILMGLGIDYGIHLYIRFKQELLKGKSIPQAVELVITQVGRSGTVAMLTTMGVFSLLMTSEFRGFSEFGQIAAIGIFCAFMSYYFLFPAQALLLDKIHWLRKPRPRLFSLKLG